jgi:hypothetical protein
LFLIVLIPKIFGRFFLSTIKTLLWLAFPDWRRDGKLGKHTLTHANSKPLLACTVAFFMMEFAFVPLIFEGQ